MYKPKGLEEKNQSGGCRAHNGSAQSYSHYTASREMEMYTNVTYLTEERDHWAIQKSKCRKEGKI